MENNNQQCANCLILSNLVDECLEVICNSAPLAWAAAQDMDGAQAWEKRAYELVQKLSSIHICIPK